MKAETHGMKAAECPECGADVLVDTQNLPVISGPARYRFPKDSRPEKRPSRSHGRRKQSPVPVKTGTTTRNGKKVGYAKWGVGGKVYTYRLGNKKARASAKSKAKKQGAAHYARKRG